MDPTQIKKIQAMNRYRRRQFLDNFYFYFFTTLTCILFCCVPLFLPYISCVMSQFLFVCIPSFLSLLFNSKFLFILGNIIIVILIVNSKFFSSKSSSSSTTQDVYYDEYIKSRVSTQTQSPQVPNFEVIKSRTRILEEHVSEYWEKVEDKEEDEEEGEASLVFDSDELSKRADAFIARVNKQRKLELSILHYETEY